MAAKELLLLVVVVVASVLLVSDGVDSHPPTSTGDDEPSTWSAARRQRDVGQPGIASALVPDTAQYRWTARRRGGVGNGHSSLTAEQWQRRERSVAITRHPPHHSSDVSVKNSTFENILLSHFLLLFFSCRAIHVLSLFTYVAYHQKCRSY